MESGRIIPVGFAAYSANQITLDTKDLDLYFKRIDRLRMAFFSVIGRLWKGDLGKELRDLMGAVDDFDHIIGWRNAIEAEVTSHYQMELTYERTYAATWPVFAERVYDSLTGTGKSMGRGFELKADDELVEEWIRRAIAWIRAEGGDLITAVEGYSHKAIVVIVRRLTEEAVRAGWSINRLKKEFRDSITTLDSFRARTIARTEVMRSSNLGSRDAAKTSGLKLKKEWLTGPTGTGDRHATADYLGLDGQTRRLDELYTLDGPNGVFQAMYPLDMMLPAEESINCFIGETIVESPDLKKAFRSRYTGKIITIETATGQRLTGTPNHPVFTPSGRIPLGCLNEGDEILYGRVSDSMSSNADVNNMPVPIEKIFDALSKTGIVLRLPSSVVNFYGDRPASDVEIIGTNGLLWDSIDSSTIQRFYHMFFLYAYFRSRLLSRNSLLPSRTLPVFGTLASDSIMSSMNVNSSLFGRHVFHALLHRIASSANFHLMTEKDFSDLSSRSTDRFGECFFRRTGSVSSDDFDLGEIGVSSFAGKFGEHESIANESRTTPEMGGHILDGHSFEVKPSKLVRINVNTVHDLPVYTLETMSGGYLANKILVSNCRCSEAYVPI